MKNESGMYGGLFDFNGDGKLNTLEKSAEMDYFADQVESSNPQSKQLCDAVWEALGGSFDQDGNPIRVEERQVELTYEFVKKEDLSGDTQINNETDSDALDISVSPEVINQIYEMAIRGELTSDDDLMINKLVFL
ncbi:MAG: hypothetical protein K6E64_07035 [Lachnospiraceae bacterium]|nr:hypothetical protein [Lachnospiraceae bacterium]